MNWGVKLQVAAYLCIGLMATATAGAQSFGTAKEKVTLLRKLPALVHLPGDSIAVRVTGHDERSNLARDLQSMLEAELTHTLGYEKPNPPDMQDLYLGSLSAIGLDPALHDMRFVEDDWENPTVGAWGLVWEVWCDGMEVSQYTYFQQVGGLDVFPVAGELTYGLERLAMVHLNDSESAKGSRHDRHAHLGEGRIGRDGLAHLLCHPGLDHVAFYLETPRMEDGYDAVNVARLGDLAAGRPLTPGPVPPAESDAERSREEATDGAPDGGHVGPGVAQLPADGRSEDSA